MGRSAPEYDEAPLNLVASHVATEETHWQPRAPRDIAADTQTTIAPPEWSRDSNGVAVLGGSNNATSANDEKSDLL